MGIVHQVNLEHLGRVVAACATASRVPDTLVGTDSHTTMINGLGVLGFGVGGIEAEAVMLGEPLELGTPLVVGVRIGRRAARGRDRDRPRADADRAAARARRRRALRRVLRRRPLGALARRPRDALQHVARVRRDRRALPRRRRDAPLPARHGPRRRSCRLVDAVTQGAGPVPARRRRRLPTSATLVELDLDAVEPEPGRPAPAAGPRARWPTCPPASARAYPRARDRRQRQAASCTTAAS